MRISNKVIMLIAAVLGLSACATVAPPAPTLLMDEISYPEPAPGSNNGSIYRSHQGLALYEDVKAKHVGDIITIVLTEATSASKSSSTSTSKSNDIAVTNPTLLGSSFGFNLPSRVSLAGGRKATLASNLESSKTFSGEGDSQQSNQLSGNITVVVTGILPNGNFKVQGKKRITINQGDEHVTISGIIRPLDIRQDNSVLSTNVANAEIVYSGSGVVANANEMGWLSEFFNSKWWPF